jgi:hypothetical protein
VDFYASEARLAVEVDGGYHAERVALDAKRQRRLERAGYWAVRVTSDRVLQHPLEVEVILRVCTTWVHPPYLLLEFESYRHTSGQTFDHRTIEGNELTFHVPFCEPESVPLVALYVSRHKVTTRLADARRRLARCFDLTMGDDDMDDVERAMADVDSWSGPNNHPRDVAASSDE